MKICIFTDPHFCAKSSILRKRGSKYSLRLHYEIDSLNWVREQAGLNTCDAIFCLGDFFDQSSVNAEESAALSEVNWGNLSWNFIVGNHDASTQSLEYSTAHLLTLCPNSYIITEPQCFVSNETRFLILPYITEDERKPLSEYLTTEKPYKKTLILSHNDIKGINYAGFESKIGFDLDDIKQNCDLFVNGHLHNGEKINNQLINLGNLLGQNFSEDAFKYSHNIMILDTDTLSYRLIENPFAINFYKLNNIDELRQIKNNSVITIKVKDLDYLNVKNIIENDPRILESRIIIERELVEDDKNVKQIELTKMDHFEQFRDYIFSNVGLDDIIKEELEEILK